jgi:hypothetical protein
MAAPSWLRWQERSGDRHGQAEPLSASGTERSAPASRDVNHGIEDNSGVKTDPEASDLPEEGNANTGRGGGREAEGRPDVQAHSGVKSNAETQTDGGLKGNDTQAHGRLKDNTGSQAHSRLKGNIRASARSGFKGNTDDKGNGESDTFAGSAAAREDRKVDLEAKADANSDANTDACSVSGADPATGADPIGGASPDAPAIDRSGPGFVGAPSLAGGSRCFGLGNCRSLSRLLFLLRSRCARRQLLGL